MRNRLIALVGALVVGLFLFLATSAAQAAAKVRDPTHVTLLAELEEFVHDHRPHGG